MEKKRQPHRMLCIPMVGVLMLFALLGAFGQAACQPQQVASDGNTTDSGSQRDGGQQESPKEPDEPKINLFDPDKIIKVEIELPAADWDAVRTQLRTYEALLEPKCREQPFGSPFTYRKGSVIIDGIRLDDVGIRKKGFVGSIDDQKPSLKIKFDEYVEAQEFAGLDRLTLNNNRSDPSFMRQCLAYHVFAKAGIPAPRCNFAHVFVNGKSLGVYAHIESVKKRFLKRHFEDNDGRLYEGTISDFRDGWMGTFEAKTLKEDKSLADVQAVTKALASPDDKLIEALEQVIDLKQFIRFWAAEVLINHLDGYAGNTNNFFIYNDPTTKKFVFLPWGVDMTFSDRQWLADGAPPHVLAKGTLARRLYRYDKTRAMYTAALTDLFQKVWDVEALRKEVDRMERLIASLAIQDRAHKGKNENFKKETDQIRAFLAKRKAELQPVIDKPPAWDVPPTDKLCFRPNGEASGTFKTSFGTLQVQDPFSSGSGTFQGSYETNEIKYMRLGVRGGLDPNVPGHLVIHVILQTEDTKFLLAVIAIQGNDIVVGEPITMRSPLRGGRSILIYHDAKTKQSNAIGLLWEGTVTLRQFKPEQGAALEGSFNIKWVAAPPK